MWDAATQKLHMYVAIIQKNWTTPGSLPGMDVHRSEVDSCAWHFLLVVRVWVKPMPVGVQDLAPGQGVQLDEVEGNEGLKENPASSRNPKDGTPKVEDSHTAYCVITKLCSLTYYANITEHCQSIAS